MVRFFGRVSLAAVLLLLVLVMPVAANVARAETPAITAMGDIVFRLNLRTAIKDFSVVGVEYLAPYIYVSGGNGINDPNYMYVIDQLGNLYDKYEQQGTVGQGWRDLATDGVSLFGSDGSTVDQFTTEGAVIDSFPGVFAVNRGLAYDPATGHLWVAGVDADWLVEIDRDGNIVREFPNDRVVYGLAWDTFTPDGPFLWAFGVSDHLAYQFDPGLGQYTGVTIPTPLTGGKHEPAGLACTLWPDPAGRKPVLLGIVQGRPDTLFAVDMGLPACDGCLIDGVCYPDESNNPENNCEICETSISFQAWTARDGESCEDGLYCTVNGICEGSQCVSAPRNCNDGLFCTGTETCNELFNSCVSSGDPCGVGEECDDGLDECLPVADDDTSVDDDTAADDDITDDDIADDDLIDDDVTDDDATDDDATDDDATDDDATDDDATDDDATDDDATDDDATDDDATDDDLVDDDSIDDDTADDDTESDDWGTEIYQPQDDDLVFDDDSSDDDTDAPDARQNEDESSSGECGC